MWNILELEPVRRLGFALDQATLKQIALDYGIQENITTMTQAEKAQLRYIALLTQNQQVQGDMSRTILSAANSMRVLKSQFEILGREIGNIVIPLLMQIIPVAIAVVKVLTKVAKAIASLFGFKLPDLNWDSVSIGTDALGGVEDAAGGAADSVKKLKRQLAGFDELNNLTSPTPSSGGGGTGAVGGAGFELELPEYDMLDGFSKGIDDLTDKIMKFFGLSEDGFGKLSWSWSDMDWKAKLFLVTLGVIGAFKGFTKLISGITTIKSGFTILKDLGKSFFGLFTGSEATGSVGILGKLGQGFSSLASALGVTGGALALIIAAIAAVVATFIHAYKNDENFKKSVDNLITSFKELCKTIGEKLQPIIDNLAPILSQLWNNVKTGRRSSIRYSIRINKIRVKTNNR